MVSWSQMIKNFDKRLDIEDIEEFQLHLTKAVNRKISKLEEEYGTVSEDDMADPRDLDAYKDHLTDVMISTQSAKILGDELSILALYKKVEIKTKKIIESKVPNPKSKNLSYINNVRSILPFELETIDGYSSFNELRLLNNAIKHGGLVSNELSSKYPSWIEGDELKDLDIAYRRLLSGVELYVSTLVERLYSLSEQP
ncbi:hypothetical protein [Photobacterium alginatilyticum]|uniref:MAE-28990/MAE-18760-like HEPN domain-containing protein n=1 Tax=Photobacterium alginatilyticum TaxID=1775171 RepID=A0ABW9YLX2_9GAMM|nr:hypothetical protein [Photobacterium alginatilyticum]NBI54690.1 hypothetical protein [Photobacterium alginatilyticum]